MRLDDCPKTEMKRSVNPSRDRSAQSLRWRVCQNARGGRANLSSKAAIFSASLSGATHNANRQARRDHHTVQLVTGGGKVEFRTIITTFVVTWYPGVRAPTRPTTPAILRRRYGGRYGRAAR